MQDKRILYERSVAQYGVKKSVQKCIEGMIEEVEQEKDKTLEHLRLLLEDKSKEESRWRKKDG